MGITRSLVLDSLLASNTVWTATRNNDLRDLRRVLSRASRRACHRRGLLLVLQAMFPVEEDAHEDGDEDGDVDDDLDGGAEMQHAGGRVSVGAGGAVERGEQDKGLEDDHEDSVWFSPGPVQLKFKLS